MNFWRKVKFITHNFPYEILASLHPMEWSFSFIEFGTNFLVLLTRFGSLSEISHFGQAFGFASQLSASKSCTQPTLHIIRSGVWARIDF